MATNDTETESFTLDDLYELEYEGAASKAKKVAFRRYYEQAELIYNDGDKTQKPELRYDIAAKVTRNEKAKQDGERSQTGTAREFDEVIKGTTSQASKRPQPLSMIMEEVGVGDGNASEHTTSTRPHTWCFPSAAEDPVSKPPA
jgi:hypothetical protein